MENNESLVNVFDVSGLGHLEREHKVKIGSWHLGWNAFTHTHTRCLWGLGVSWRKQGAEQITPGECVGDERPHGRNQQEVRKRQH